MMIKAKVNLYLLILNKESLKYDIVSKDKKKIVIPSFEINKEINLIDEIRKEFENNVQLSSRFVSFVLSDAFVENQELIIEYYCLVPYMTNLKNSYLLSTDVQKNYSKNILKVLQSI